MVSSTLLVTGVTGFLGSTILIDAIKAGHHVRAAVRNADKEKSLLQNQYVKEALSSKGAGKLEFVHIPDLLSPTAYTSALADGKISHIIHCASPLGFATDDIRRDIINPARQGTLNLIEAAAKLSSVRRIVITASVASNTPKEPVANGKITAATRLPDPTDEQIDGLNGDFWSGYFFSKVVALNATDRFVAANPNISFDVVNVLPGFIIGRNPVALKADDLASGSNRMPVSMATKGDMPGRLAASIHVADVSAIHIGALNESVVPFRSRVDLLAASEPDLATGKEIVERNFPEQVKSGLFKPGTESGVYHNYDAKDTEKRIGKKFNSYEDMLVDVLTQYVSLSKA